MTYEPFAPRRRLAEYAGQAGHEVGGQMLTPAAYQALGDSRTSGLPCELVVTGTFVYPDGRRFLEVRVPQAFIEATTDFRDRDGKLRYRCPDCEQWDGKHSKACGL